MSDSDSPVIVIALIWFLQIDIVSMNQQNPDLEPYVIQPLFVW